MDSQQERRTPEDDWQKPHEESVGAKHAVEVGTSNGYSGLWLSLALRGSGGPHFGRDGLFRIGEAFAEAWRHVEKAKQKR